MRYTDKTAESWVAIILPTINEAGTIGYLIRNLVSLDGKTRIYVVDDGSTDGTASIVKKHAKRFRNVILFERTATKGLGDAIRFGMREALTDLNNNTFVTMDADFSHYPSHLPKILSTDADLVIGSRYISGGRIIGWSSFRRLMSMTANWLSRVRLGIRAKDVTSGYRAYSRRAAELVASKSVCDGFPFQVEAVWLIQQAGLRIQEIPICFRDRMLGDSKLTSIKEVSSMISFLASPNKDRTTHT